jgi:N-acetylneuraminic acid mutarotase
VEVLEEYFQRFIPGSDAKTPGVLASKGACKTGPHLDHSPIANDRSVMSMSHKIFAAALIASALLAATAVAQGTGRWTSGAAVPLERSEVAVAEVGTKIYVLGGFHGERELEIYDPATDRWSRGTAIPRAVHHAAAVGLNGKLYLIGGYVDGWTPTDEVHEYDPATDGWRQRAPLPTPRGALAAAVIDGKIHAVSGNGRRGRNTGAHEVYDPAVNRWIR